MTAATSKVNRQNETRKKFHSSIFGMTQTAPIESLSPSCIVCGTNSIKANLNRLNCMRSTNELRNRERSPSLIKQRFCLHFHREKLLVCLKTFHDGDGVLPAKIKLEDDSVEWKWGSDVNGFVLRLPVWIRINLTIFLFLVLDFALHATGCQKQYHCKLPHFLNPFVC